MIWAIFNYRHRKTYPSPKLNMFPGALMSATASGKPPSDSQRSGLNSSASGPHISGFVLTPSLNITSTRWPGWTSTYRVSFVPLIGKVRGMMSVVVDYCKFLWIWAPKTFKVLTDLSVDGHQGTLGPQCLSYDSIKVRERLLIVQVVVCWLSSVFLLEL